LPKSGNKGEALPKRGNKGEGFAKRENKGEGRVLEFLNQDWVTCVVKQKISGL